MDNPLLQVNHLKKWFPAQTNALFRSRRRSVKAVDDISFSVNAGEVVGIVGESGCGKSTLGRLIVRLIEPTSGQIVFDGVDTTKLGRENLRKLRLKMQIVFQDPFGSLNPRMTVGNAIAYPLKVHSLYHGRALRMKVEELLERVGLNAAHARRLPHELSGGQRQRIGIARAIGVNPKLVVADEPVAALDLSAQAQVLNLFKELQREMKMTYIFITHDLSVAEYMADRIIVMYSGKTVEMADRQTLFNSPKHPYTEALLSAAVLGSWRNIVRETILEGDPPSPIEPPAGCRFHTRCPYAGPICEHDEPPLVPLGTTHLAACHLITGKLQRRETPSRQPSVPS